MRNPSENLHATKKRLLEKLRTGKENALKLQQKLGVYSNPVKQEGSVSEEELANEILRSFTQALALMTSSCSAAPTQIVAVDCSGSGTGAGDGRNKATGVKDRRGCYKRKRTSDSRTTISSTAEDGRAWRKYGQKDIMNSNHPRCYYRCTHKPQGCKATKQVEKLQEEPLLYQITYFDDHTCTDMLLQLPQLILESDHTEPNLLSFRQNNSIHTSPNPMKIVSSLKQESEVCFPCSTSWGDPSSWPGVVSMESGSMGSNQVWSDPRMLASDDGIEEAVSGLYSCSSITSLQGFGTEVDQLLGDIDFDET